MDDLVKQLFMDLQLYLTTVQRAEGKVPKTMGILVVAREKGMREPGELGVATETP